MSENSTPQDPNFRKLSSLMEEMQSVLGDYDNRLKFVRNFKRHCNKGKFDAIEDGKYFDLMDFRIKERNGTCVESMIVAMTPRLEAWLAKYAPSNIEIEDIESGVLSFEEILERQRASKQSQATKRGRPVKLLNNV
jgi:hypothetical protein